MQKITPFLWYDTQAEEAAQFYVSLFDESKMGYVSHYGKEGAAASGQPEGSAMTVSFTVKGMDFMALNGGPYYKFTPAVSFMVECADQDEVDRYWDGLSAGGGQEQPCGWVTDKYGVSWQIIPKRFNELMSDASKAPAVMAAMLKMKKLIIADLEKAAQ